MTTERRDEPSGGARTRADGVAHQRRADRDLDLLDALGRRGPMAAERLVTRYGERAYRLARPIPRNGHDDDVALDEPLSAGVGIIPPVRAVPGSGALADPIAGG